MLEGRGPCLCASKMTLLPKLGRQVFTTDTASHWLEVSCFVCNNMGHSSSGLLESKITLRSNTNTHITQMHRYTSITHWCTPITAFQFPHKTRGVGGGGLGTIHPPLLLPGLHSSFYSPPMPHLSLSLPALSPVRPGTDSLGPR